MRKKISQAEAWSMKHQLRRMKEAEEKRNNAYAREWPEGIYLQTLNVDPVAYVRLKTARRLGFALLAITPNDDKVEFYAVRN